MIPAWGKLLCLGTALLALRFAAPWWCGRHADAWFDGDIEVQSKLANHLVNFEAADDREREQPGAKLFEGKWALLTHQMIALGLAQVALAHPERKDAYASVITRAAVKSFLPEMRDFGTKAWRGEDAMKSLDGPHGHAYLAYPALAIGMARWLDSAFPSDVAKRHDALIATYERRLLASPTALIETYPNQAYPTDVAAVAAAIAVHGRATGAHHERVLAHWADKVRTKHIDPETGLVFQRMTASNANPQDLPRGSGTGLAAYYAGFADAKVAKLLADGLFRHSSTLWSFMAIQEYADGRTALADGDSGPAILGVSVGATGFALAPARASSRRDEFVRLYRTTALVGHPHASGESAQFLTGGAIGNALLLAFLTSGPELAP